MDNFYYMAERTGTLWENIGAYASCNHGFASHIVHVLYRDILGIYHIDYLKKKITLRFTDINLKSCRGQIPIGDQMVKLEWQRDAKAIHYAIDTPEGYEVEVKNLSGLEISKTAGDVK
jgi:alpha-L-rhamnosidase